MKNLFPLSIAAVLSVLTFAAPVQTQTWIKYPANGHYYAITQPMSWHQAETQAVLWTGHLATVRSQAENDWLAKTFGNKHLWIGLNDEAKEGTWVWSSGENASFRNWCDREPNGGRNDNWVHIHDQSKPIICNPRRWNDRNSTVAPLFVGIMELKSAPAMASFTTIGAGCKGSKNLVPALSALALPKLGKSLVLSLKGGGNLLLSDQRNSSLLRVYADQA